MGKSSHTSKSRAKTEKGTQSPMLKIFAEMMQREKNNNNPDIEKSRLFRDKRKKRKHSKPIEQNQKSDGSSTVMRVQQKFKKVKHHHDPVESKTFPIADDKKESWWLFGGNYSSRKSSNSGISCQLKRLFASDYACPCAIGCCLIVILLLACLISCKTLAVTASKSFGADSYTIPTEQPKTILEHNHKLPDFDGSRLHRSQEQPRPYRKLDFGRNIRRSIPNEFSKNLAGSVGIYNMDSDSELSNLDNLGELPANDLSSVLDPKQFSVARISPKMKHFYKKLMETDAQIQNLKKGIYDNSNTASSGEDKSRNQNSYYRLKRSLLHHKSHKNGAKANTATPKLDKDSRKKDAKNKNKHKKHKHNKDREGNKEKRVKRFENGTEIAAPTGIVIEKKKFFIKYLEDGPKFPKCSHKNNDVIEKSAKLSNGRNRQQLNELLDTFLNSDILNNEFALENNTKKSVDYDDDTIENDILHLLYMKHKSNPVLTTAKSKDLELTASESATDEPKRDIKYITNKKLGQELNYQDSEIADNLSESEKTAESTTENTITLPVYPSASFIYDTYNTNSRIKKSADENSQGKRVFETDEKLLKVPGRKLLQSEEEEDEENDEFIGYEDFKEVLSDDMGAHDENDRQIERKKRNDQQQPDIDIVMAATPKPPRQVLMNPNWKGPSALYPDEVNDMQNRVKPVDQRLKEEPKETQKEIYIPNKKEDNKPAELVQAYSDYGVLIQMVAKKAEDKNDIKIKGSKESQGKLKREIDRKANSNWKQGLSMQYRPTDLIEFTNTEENLPAITESVDSDLSPDSQSEYYKRYSTSASPMNKNIEVHKYPSSKDSFHKNRKFNHHNKNMNNTLNKIFDGLSETVTNKGLLFIFNKKKGIITYPNQQNNDEGKSATTIAHIDETNRILYKYYKLNNTRPYEHDLRSNRMKRSVQENFSSDTDLDTDVDKEYIEDLTNLKNKSSVVSGYKNKGLKNLTNEILKHLKGDIESNETRSDDISSNETKSEMERNSFLWQLSNWFDQLASMSVDSSDTNVSSSLKPRRNASEINVTREIEYPSYDSDMIDNIGHRSRVLLSIEDKGEANPTESSTDGVSTDNKLSNVTSTTAAPAVFTESVITKRSTEGQDSDKTNVENKTIVKRSAENEDSDLVSWNDLYDDEYGIKLDPLNDNVEDKRTGELIKKSAGWLQDKVRSVADSIKRRSKQSIDRLYKKERPKRQDFVDYDKTKEKEEQKPDLQAYKIDFAELTANMKEVCKHAAEAVQNTRRVNQRDQDTALASGLMQNLIKLMSELVDYEVEQKSCLKLPADLRVFLEWLTMPPAGKKQVFRVNEKKTGQEESISDSQMVDLATTRSSEREESWTDARSECLGTINAVKSLISEYAQLSEEDKEKMGGVKEYLEGQLAFLNKHLGVMDESYLTNFFNKNAPFRFKRQPKGGNKRSINLRNALKQRFGRNYFSNFYKRHTKTTLSGAYEAVTISTDDQRAISNVDARSKNAEDSKERDNRKTKTEKENVNNKETVDAKAKYADKYAEKDVKTKRNLKDVYYKALSDAKKTTLKNIQY